MVEESPENAALEDRGVDDEGGVEGEEEAEEHPIKEGLVIGNDQQPLVLDRGPLPLDCDPKQQPEQEAQQKLGHGVYPSVVGGSPR
jgi:hypothetical protein